MPRVLEPAQAKEVADKLAEVDKLAAKVAALKKTRGEPRLQEGGGDALRRRGVEGQGRRGEGRRAREDDRRVARADDRRCAPTSKWAPSMRACIVAGGGDAVLHERAVLAPWGFPALGVFVKVGVAECDSYAESVKAADACCALLAQSQRDAVQAHVGLSVARAAASAPPDRRQALAQRSAGKTTSRSAGSSRTRRLQDLTRRAPLAR